MDRHIPKEGETRVFGGPAKLIAASGARFEEGEERLFERKPLTPGQLHP